VPLPERPSAAAPARLAAADRVLLGATVAAGVATPWALAIGVKAHLESRGVPTWPWSFVARWIAVSLFLSPFYAAPFFALAAAAWLAASGRMRLGSASAPGERRAVVLCGAACGVAGMVHVLLPVFREFHPIVILVLPLLVARYAAFLAAGAAVGYGAVRLLRAARR